MLIAALAVAASAALPPAHPPATTMSGVRISWPVKAAETSVEPGTTLAVRLRSSNRRSRVSFVRADASGRSMKVIARRTLRTGTFSVKVPSTTTRARYALRIEIAGRKRFSWVTTAAPVAAPVPAPVPAAATPVPEPTPPLDMCGGLPARPWSGFKGVLELAATQIQAGQSLPYTLRNVGQYELLDDETYVLVAVPPTGPTSYGGGSAYTRIQPGATAAHTATVPPETTPGRYRIVHSTSTASCDVLGLMAVISEPFDVLAP